MIKNKFSGLESILKKGVLVAATTSAILLSGCGGETRIRLGYTPNSNFGNPEKLGRHSYSSGGSEGSGILYTLKGGSLDLDHIRGTADQVKCSRDKCYSAITQSKTEFSFSPPMERITNNVGIKYPSNWSSLSEKEKEKIAKQVSLEVGGYVGFNSNVFHEMLTWKGVHFALIEPEFNSAFSWEDLYSDCLGVNLAKKAIDSLFGDYDSEMTYLMKKEIAELGVVSRAEAEKITNSVKGKWFTPGFIPDTKRRNFDIGYNDGMVNPSIIPGFTKEAPVPQPAPKLEAYKKYGFEIKYTVTSSFSEVSSLKKDGGVVGRALEPVRDFPAIIEVLKKESLNKYNHQVDD